MTFDALLLSRLQFAFVVSFHILFPAFTIGLASYLAVLEALWLKTGRDVYHRLYRFWLRAFAVSFGLGVVSGVVMAFQFGTNWSRFTAAAGNILGPLMSYEVLTAFFLEASFLGIMLFGEARVGRRLHFLATCMVALGTLLSTFWILAANSWMHTPAGFVVRSGVFYPVEWTKIIFNPSFPYRLVHMTLAAYLTTAFAVAGLAARYLLRDLWREEATVMLKMAVGFIAVVAPLQIVAGDLHGLNVRDHQPAKLAAIEAHWDSQETPVPFRLFAVPDSAREENSFEIAVPYAGSLVLTHSLDGRLRGLRDFAADERPPVATVFYSFRLMLAIGIAMLATGLVGAWLLLRGRLTDARGFHRACLLMTPAGFVAVIAGWVTAEVGRQPYVVYGWLHTAEAVAPVATASVAASLVAFLLVYAFIFGAGSYYLLKVIRTGFAPPAPEPELVRTVWPLAE